MFVVRRDSIAPHTHTLKWISTNQHVVPTSWVVNYVAYGDREEHTSFHNKNINMKVFVTTGGLVRSSVAT